MLNMIDTQDKLKNFSEQQLIQEMQQPSGSAPQFMVLGEIERRKRMRADMQRQQGLMQPTVAQEAVSAAGVPQQGIAQVAQSLAPKTDMTQNTGVPNAQAASLPAQPNQPQRMADGGVLRFAPGGGLSGGTISAIANLKVKRPDIYEEYKDDPEALAMAAEYFQNVADTPERTGLESLEAPYVDPYGPQGLAQRTAAAEVGNQARRASETAQQREIDRMLEINAPLGSGRRGAPLDAAARRRIAEEDMAMGMPVPRDDFRTFPVTVPQAKADPTYAEDEFFFNAGMFDRTAPENVAAQPRGSDIDNSFTLPTPAAAAPQAEESGSAMSDRAEAIAAGLIAPVSAAEQPRRSELEAAPQAAAPQVDEAGFASARPQAEGIASFGVFDPLVDRLKEIRSEDAARNAAANAGDLGAFLGVGSENDPSFLSETFSDPVARFRSEMAARQGAGERNYANAVQGIESLNQRIADAKAAGDEILAQQLTTARDQLGGTLRNKERATDVAEGILTIPTAVNTAFQESSLGVGLRGPDATARTLTELAAEQKAAVEAEATRERRLAELLGGATPTSTAAAEAAQEEFSQRPDTQDVKPAAEQKKIAAAMKTVTDPAAMPPAIKSGTGGTGKKSGIAAEKSKMDQDKWLALAQAGFTLMSTGDFGKAGSAGLAAYREAQKGDREERKLDAELILREAQLAAANRKGTTAKTAPASLVTAAASRLKTASDAMSSAVTPAQKQSAADEYALALQEYNNLQRFVASQYGYTGGSTRAQVGPANLSDSANKT